MPHYLVTLIPRPRTRRSGWPRSAVPVTSPPGTWSRASCPVPPGPGRSPRTGCCGHPSLAWTSRPSSSRPEQQAALADLFDVGDDLSGALMSAPPVDAAPAPHLVPDARMPGRGHRAGPGVGARRGRDRARSVPLATEIVVYLATHPAGVHPNVLAGPSGRGASRTRTWTPCWTRSPTGSAPTASAARTWPRMPAAGCAWVPGSGWTGTSSSPWWPRPGRRAGRAARAAATARRRPSWRRR